jgi:predicted PolB exonuclease-like 3'-5' exonuclease
MNILVFDIETIPDLDAGRKIYDLAGLSDEDTLSAMQTLRRIKTGNDFFPHYLQKIVAISLVLEKDNQCTVWSLGDESSTEKELIQRFYHGIEKYMPTLVSWNGGGFDLPVLHYRALHHAISAPTYWESGEHKSDFRWNNYLNRFHYRHMDLMDILAAYQSKAYAPLDDIAVLLGFPGKMGMKGDKVFDEYQSGNLAGIRNYCETDVLNTYCVYLRFELMRGSITEQRYHESILNLKNYLNDEGQKRPHLKEFLNKLLPE